MAKIYSLPMGNMYTYLMKHEKIVKKLFMEVKLKSLISSIRYINFELLISIVWNYG